jgi:hypothetical protein
VEFETGIVRQGEHAKLIHAYDPELDPSIAIGSATEDVFGGGTLRFALSGGNLANRSMRSLFIAVALISANPGLWSPTTLDEKEDRSLVASLAWQ